MDTAFFVQVVKLANDFAFGCFTREMNASHFDATTPSGFDLLTKVNVGVISVPYLYGQQEVNEGVCLSMAYLKNSKSWCSASFGLQLRNFVRNLVDYEPKNKILVIIVDVNIL